MLTARSVVVRVNGSTLVDVLILRLVVGLMQLVLLSQNGAARLRGRCPNELVD